MFSETIRPCTLVLYIISKELCKELREISSLVIADNRDEVGSKLIFHKVELTALQSFVAMLGKVSMTVVEM